MQSDVVWGSIQKGFIKDSRLTDAPSRPAPPSPRLTQTCVREARTRLAIFGSAPVRDGMG